MFASLKWHILRGTLFQWHEICYECVQFWEAFRKQRQFLCLWILPVSCCEKFVNLKYIKHFLFCTSPIWSNFCWPVQRFNTTSTELMETHTCSCSCILGKFEACKCLREIWNCRAKVWNYHSHNQNIRGRWLHNWNSWFRSSRVWGIIRNSHMNRM